MNGFSKLGRNLLPISPMDTMKNLQDRIERLIDSVHDRKSADELEVVRQQVESLCGAQQAAQKENRRISAENLELMSKNKVLTQQIHRLNVERHSIPAAPPAPNEFIEHLGILFCRRPGGFFHQAAYCPKCRRRMKTVSEVLPFTCSACRTTTPFTANELNDVVVKLERS